MAPVGFPHEVKTRGIKDLWTTSDLFAVVSFLLPFARQEQHV
jgi:hypothetical protein